MPGPVSDTETTNASVRGFRFDPHLAGLGELDRIAHQVQEYLGDSALVATPGGQVGRDLEIQGEVLLRGQRFRRREGGLNHLLERVLGDGERKLAGLHLREIEDVVDESQAVPTAPVDPLPHVTDLVRGVAVHAIQDQLGIAEDGVERRT